MIFITLGNFGLATVSDGEVCVKLMWPPVLPLFVQQAIFRNLTAYIAIIILVKEWNPPQRAASAVSPAARLKAAFQLLFEEDRRTT